MTHVVTIMGYNNIFWRWVVNRWEIMVKCAECSWQYEVGECKAGT